MLTFCCEEQLLGSTAISASQSSCLAISKSASKSKLVSGVKGEKAGAEISELVSESVLEPELESDELELQLAPPA